jgi:hypothetical protein
MLTMLDNHATVMHEIFIGSKFESLNGMLMQWRKRTGGILQVDEEREGFSALDDEEVIEKFFDEINAERGKPKPKPKPKPKTPNEESVSWAVNTIYADKSGTMFDSAWFQSLSIMADTAEYRSIQLAKANALHGRAMTLFRHFKMTQIRSYLFFFDIMVQNGGINEEIVATIDKILAKKTHSETEKLQVILKERLPFVKKKYREDVRSRKQSLIDGSGVVHQHMRSYDLEYCSQINAQLFPDASDIQNSFNL